MFSEGKGDATVADESAGSGCCVDQRARGGEGQLYFWHRAAGRC